VGYYAASSDNFLQTFRDNLSDPSSGVEPIGFPKRRYEITTTRYVTAQKSAFNIQYEAEA